MSTDIQKVVISGFGEVSNVSVVQSTILPPGKGEVQVRIFYSGFSGADINMRNGTYPFQRKAPLTPGYCFTGRVVANGQGSSSFKEGEIVAGVTTYDCEAEMANFKENLIVRVPPELLKSSEASPSSLDETLQQITALSLDWTTAYGLVEHAAHVKEGQRVFIHGLSGAVGQALTKLCLLKGAIVYGTASARNHAALAEQGVTRAFDYSNKDWIKVMSSKEIGGAQAIFDALGFESWDESWSILASDGILVGFGGNMNTLGGDKDSKAKTRAQWPTIITLLARGTNPLSKKRTSFYYIKPGTSEITADIKALMTMFGEGKVRVPIKAVWDLNTEAVREAHNSWGKMAGMGSLLIRVSKPDN
jgi:NADPH:quinone reductase-like Zn-dependent oxidoreductase